MLLDKINKTNDIKRLNQKEKKQLAQEIREYILKVISNNGGHLASNLGTVELTIALESVFDPGKDRIIWDVGHQCYTHKILNGRKNELKTLRKFNGISGFPKISESKTDAFNTGHSSTSISAAMGMAKARDLKKRNQNIVAVIGDGALTGGMAMEALNHVGSSGTNMIVVLNDNEMSISKNVGGINKLLTKLRVKKNYTKSNKYGKKVISHIPIVGNAIISLVSKMKDSIKQLIIPGMYFEEIGFRYLGPFDGHDIDELEDIFRQAKELEGPTLIHVITKKGKGYKIAEDNPDRFHGVGKFDLETGNPVDKKGLDYSKTFGKKLVELAKKNKNIVAITAAMKDGTGLAEFAKTFPERFFDVGIAEQHALTFAAGLASNGLIPCVNIYSSFYQRCYDQVIHDICTQNLPVVMFVDRAGIVGNDGETHQGMFDLSFFRCVPNLTIMAPANFTELELMMDFAIKLGKPVAIRFPRGGESSINIPVKQVRNGKCNVLSSGNDITILAIGKTVSKAVSVSERLKNDNVNCEVINCRFLKPFDQKTVVESIKKTGKVAVIEDGTIIGGLCSQVKEIIAENNLNIESKFFAYPDKFIEHGDVSQLESKYKNDEDSIYTEILNLIK